MTTVFLGGSRRISRLNADIRERLDRIIEQNFEVIIGDANGADKAIQTYLHSKNYSHVEVFCSGGVCRNNVGRWNQRTVAADKRNRDFDFYATKDRLMADEATVGFMLWDGSSVGTILNVFRLVDRHKKARIYDVSGKQFRDFSNSAHLESFISSCGLEVARKIKQKLALECREGASTSQPSSPWTNLNDCERKGRIAN